MAAHPSCLSWGCDICIGLITGMRSAWCKTGEKRKENLKPNHKMMKN